MIFCSRIAALSAISLQSAEPDRVRDAMRRLLLTPVFDDLNKRSLLARIVKLYPEMQSMISGDAGEREEILTVSWASLEKRKQEFEDLVNRQIPQNTKDIATARSYGDLRENFEFKSAKEQQRVLMRRRAEAERDLSRARGTNFENPDVSQVSIGTVVTLRDSKGDEETYSHPRRVGQCARPGDRILQGGYRAGPPRKVARRQRGAADGNRKPHRQNRANRTLHRFGRTPRKVHPLSEPAPA